MKKVDGLTCEICGEDEGKTFKYDKMYCHACDAEEYLNDDEDNEGDPWLYIEMLEWLKTQLNGYVINGTLTKAITEQELTELINNAKKELGE